MPVIGWRRQLPLFGEAVGVRPARASSLLAPLLLVQLGPCAALAACPFCCERTSALLLLVQLAAFGV
eukprot:365304-Chlamydomonas_euryale.AAC.2